MTSGADVNTLVTGIWCEILGIEGAQPTDSFFDFAGTSIIAEQLASRISDALPVEISGVDILRRRTLSSVVALVESRIS